MPKRERYRVDVLVSVTFTTSPGPEPPLLHARFEIDGKEDGFIEGTDLQHLKDDVCERVASTVRHQIKLLAKKVLDAQT